MKLRIYLNIISKRERLDNSMKANVNLQLSYTHFFDSGALGMLAMVVHQFTAAGLYRAVIKQRGIIVTDTHFIVEEQSGIAQLDFDLATAVSKALARPNKYNCCCCNSSERHIHSLSLNGYALFHASFGCSYSAAVINEEGKTVFDTEYLNKGDLFAVSFLDSAVYSIVNKLDSSGGEIIVKEVSGDFDKLVFSPQTKYIDVKRKKLEPEKTEVVSSQGVVFKINSPARIVIEEKKETAKKRKLVSHWQKAI